MTTILLTGFGPFPGRAVQSDRAAGRGAGAPAPSRRSRMCGASRTSFHVSYEAVDRELPALLAREKPDVLVMFGLARRERGTCASRPARATRSRAHVPDAAGRARRPPTTIAPDAPATLPLRAPAQRLLMAARATGDAGRALARRRALSLQLSVLARGRGCRARPARRGSSAFVHVPIGCSASHATAARGCAAAAVHARRSRARRRGDRARGARGGAGAPLTASRHRSAR